MTISPTDGDLAPAIGATVRVCQAGATGYPCTPLITLYTDQTLQTVQPLNPLTTDSLGNFTFCANASIVYLETTNKGVVKVQPTYVIAPGSGGGGGGGGIQTINGNANPDQLITGTSPIVVSSAAGTTNISYSGTVVGPPVLLGTLTLAPTSVQGGLANSTGTVTLTGPAPTGGAVVTLTSSNTAAATVPASVTIAAGSTSNTFTVTTSTVASSTSSVISGTYGSLVSATLSVTAAPPPAQPVYGGVGVSGGTGPATLSGTIVTLNNGVTLPQIKATTEVSGDQFTFNPAVSGQWIYILLNGSTRTFSSGGLPVAMVLPPVAVTVNTRTMYLYQTVNALSGTFVITVN